jgi:hypothetical protein
MLAHRRRTFDPSGVEDAGVLSLFMGAAQAAPFVFLKNVEC